MSFYIGGQETELEYVSEPERLLERVPRHQANVQLVKDIREAQAEAARVEQNMTVTGSWKTAQDGMGVKQVAAEIPWSLWAHIQYQHPGFWTNKKEVYRWLRNQGKVWKTGQTIIRG